jgi:ankyrin repeat protein
MMAVSEYEIFDAAQRNNLKRVKELLDSGVDVNFVDYDNGNTALHAACSNGGKQTIEFLLQRGANINAVNNNGLTPLHMLISKQYNALALWLVKQGANLHIEDKRGYSARDLALGYFQTELDGNYIFPFF